MLWLESILILWLESLLFFTGSNGHKDSSFAETCLRFNRQKKQKLKRKPFSKKHYSLEEYGPSIHSLSVWIRIGW